MTDAILGSTTKADFNLQLTGAFNGLLGALRLAPDSLDQAELEKLINALHQVSDVLEKHDTAAAKVGFW